MSEQTVDEEISPENEARIKGYYFDNYAVEQLLIRYVRGGCVDVDLRDEIMGHAEELIEQVIRTHKFHEIYPGRDDSSFMDLFQVAWAQIESALYKFDCGPKRTRVFNMWSQIAKNCILAHIKKETRDLKNQGTYRKHLTARPSKRTIFMERFLKEAREVCHFDEEYIVLLEALEEIYTQDDRPYDGLINKLIKKSGLPRAKISNFLKYIRMRSFDFSDSPLNNALPDRRGLPDGRRKKYDVEEDD